MYFLDEENIMKMKKAQRFSGFGLLKRIGYMKYEKGFTLIELMVTLAIGFILLAVGIPAVGSLIGNNQITTQANKFTKSIVLARSEAVKRRVPVVICSSTDQATCAESNDWSTGWIVFTDDDGDEGVLDDTDTLLLSRSGLDGNSAFTTNVNFVRYRNTGAVEGAGSIDYTLSAGNCHGKQMRSISIRPQGYSSVQIKSCDEG